MLFILHVVMKTLDKTCCHVYIYPKCLYDNITTLGCIMDKEQALARIESYFEAHRISTMPDYYKGIIAGFLSACSMTDVFSHDELVSLQDRLDSL